MIVVERRLHNIVVRIPLEEWKFRESLRRHNEKILRIGD